VVIHRLAPVRVACTLFREEEVPPGFIPVAGGPFRYQGDQGNPFSEPKELRYADTFFMKKFPVTCREYLAFLNAGVEGLRTFRRAPRESEQVGYYWPRGESGRYSIPTRARFSETPSEARARRLAQSPVDWDEEMPVYSISWADAMAFAAWFAKTAGVPACLPHEFAWEKCARGADGRVYPWGNHFDATYANSAQSHEGLGRPCPVDSFPIDESPYGVRGLSGNADDWCLNGSEKGGDRFLRGGAWLRVGLSFRSTYRRSRPSSYVNRCYSFRIFVPCRLGVAEPGAVPEDEGRI
jgi:serine/threonine-protein kinase